MHGFSIVHLCCVKKSTSNLIPGILDAQFVPLCTVYIFLQWRKTNRFDYLKCLFFQLLDLLKYQRFELVFFFRHPNLSVCICNGLAQVLISFSCEEYKRVACLFVFSSKFSFVNVFPSVKRMYLVL